MLRHLACTVAALVLIPAASLWAQPKPADLKKLPEKRFSGELQQVLRGVIALKVSDSSEPVYVGINQGVPTRVTILGTAEPDFLGPGMFVQFSAMVDKQGNCQGELKEILLYEPEATTGPVFSLDDPVGTPSDSEVHKYFIRGQVKANRDGELTIVCSGQTVKAKIGDKTKITIGLSNIALATVGDKVAVVGKEFEKNKIIAERVDITLSKPLAPRRRGR